MEETLKKQKFSVYNIIFIIVVIAQIIFLSVSFAVNNTAHHEDEYFSYGLANSQNRVYLYGSAFQVPDNYNVWMTGDDFKYYIETNEESRFSYDTVWKNQAADTHPPLYYAVLHTICSFFPDQFSWWWAFGINLFCFAVTQVFLYKFFSRFAKSQLAGVIVCIYWGLSLGGQSNVYFLRMYMMLTMFAVMYAYFSQTVLTAEGKIPLKQFIFVGLTAFFGALTQHNFLVFAFMYTLIQCIILLIKKRVKDCFAYGGSAAVGVGLSIAAFPATIAHMFSTEMHWSGEIDPAIQRYQYLRVVVRNMTGYIMNFFEMNYYADVIAIILCVMAVFAAACFVCRKEKWFIPIAEKCKNALRTLWANFKKADLSPIMIFAASVLVFEIVVHKVYLYDLELDSVRYFYIFLPLVIGVFISWIYVIGTHISKKICTPVICVALAALLVYQNVRITPTYVLSDSPENGTVSSYVKGQNCVVLVSSPIFLPCYCTMLADTNNDYITPYVHCEFEAHADEYKKLYENGEDFYVLFDTNKIAEKKTDENSKALTYDYIIDYFEDISGYKATYCTQQREHYMDVRLYKFEKQTEN